MQRRHAMMLLTAAGAGLLARPAQAETIGYDSWKLGMLVGGSFTLQASQAALKLAQHPRVQEFAGFEIAEQTALAQVLLDTSDANPPIAPLDAQHQAALNSLRGRTAPEFDLTYVDAQIVGHRELLQLLQNYLGGPLTDPVRRRTAILVRPMLMEHLALLNGLQQMLQGTGG